MTVATLVLGGNRNVLWSETFKLFSVYKREALQFRPITDDNGSSKPRKRKKNMQWSCLTKREDFQKADSIDFTNLFISNPLPYRKSLDKSQILLGLTQVNGRLKNILDKYRK
jgi:hypothetical protein